MPKITFIKPDGEEIAGETLEDEVISETAERLGLKIELGVCEGHGACGQCEQDYLLADGSEPSGWGAVRVCNIIPQIEIKIKLGRWLGREKEWERK